MDYNAPHYIGIDYSMTSPAISTWDSSTDFKFVNTKNYCLTTQKKFVNFDVVPNIEISLNDFKKGGTNEYRFSKITEWAMDIISKTPNPYKIYLENYSFGSRGTVFHIGENTGVLKHYIFKRHVSLEVIPPTKVKLFATGKGNANKEFLNETFEKEEKIQLKEKLGQTEKQWNPSSDIIDAFYILKTGLKKSDIIT